MQPSITYDAGRSVEHYPVDVKNVKRHGSHGDAIAVEDHRSDENWGGMLLNCHDIRTKMNDGNFY